MPIEHPKSKRGEVRLRCLLAALLVLLLLAGCDGDEEGDSAAPATTTESVPAQPTETEQESDPAEDKGIAREAVLALEDFPSGWQEDDEDVDRISDCPGVRQARETISAREDAPGYSRDNAQAESVIYAYPDETAAAEAFDKLAIAETRTCLDDAAGALKRRTTLSTWATRRPRE
jgi:hypothetical protein